MEREARAVNRSCISGEKKSGERQVGLAHCSAIESVRGSRVLGRMDLELKQGHHLRESDKPNVCGGSNVVVVPIEINRWKRVRGTRRDLGFTYSTHY